VVTRAAAVVLLAVIAAALLWSAGEQHYRACVETRFVTGAGGSDTGVRFTDEPPAPLGSVSVSGCDRWPF
jgi:hypothetical protein